MTNRNDGDSSAINPVRVDSVQTLARSETSSNDTETTKASRFSKLWKRRSGDNGIPSQVTSAPDSNPRNAGKRRSTYNEPSTSMGWSETESQHVCEAFQWDGGKIHAASRLAGAGWSAEDVLNLSNEVLLDPATVDALLDAQANGWTPQQSACVCRRAGWKRVSARAVAELQTTGLSLQSCLEAADAARWDPDKLAALQKFISRFSGSRELLFSICYYANWDEEKLATFVLLYRNGWIKSQCLEACREAKWRRSDIEGLIKLYEKGGWDREQSLVVFRTAGCNIDRINLIIALRQQGWEKKSTLEICEAAGWDSRKVALLCRLKTWPMCRRWDTARKMTLCQDCNWDDDRLTLLFQLYNILQNDKSALQICQLSGWNGSWLDVSKYLKQLGRDHQAIVDLAQNCDGDPQKAEKIASLMKRR